MQLNRIKEEKMSDCWSATELKYCPNCGRIYSDEDYCIDCAYDEDGTDPVELSSLGEFTPEELKTIKKGKDE